MQHRRYVQTLEDLFLPAVGMDRAGPPTAISLPACDTARRLLAVEYARLHWRLRTSSKPDSAEGWWNVRVEPPAAAHHMVTTAGGPAAGATGLVDVPRIPRPLLSDLCFAPGTAAGHLLPAMGIQPRLHFTGIRGAGDEIYDLVGLEGLLGVRPGQHLGEAFAFMSRSALAAAAVRRLTGQAPGDEPLPVRGTVAGSAWGAAASARGAQSVAGLRVLLEQTLSGKPTGAASGPRPVSGTVGGIRAAEPTPVVPDSWEDADS